MVIVPAAFLQKLAHGNCNKKINFFSKKLRKKNFLDKV